MTFFSISIMVVEGPNGGFLICRRWTSPELPDTACPPHWGFEKKKENWKNWTKDNYFQVERLSQWFTFRKSKEEKLLIIETSTRIFRVGESAGWPRHLALAQICNKEALLGSRVLKQTISIWLWGDRLVCHCLLRHKAGCFLRCISIWSDVSQFSKVF